LGIKNSTCRGKLESAKPFGRQRRFDLGGSSKKSKSRETLKDMEAGAQNRHSARDAAEATGAGIDRD